MLTQKSVSGICRLSTVLLFLLLSVGFFPEAEAREAKTILVSVRPYALILNSLKPNQDKVEVLIEEGGDNHSFQLRASHLKKIARADLIIWGGESLEPALAKFLGQQKTAQLIIDELPGLETIQYGDSHGHRQVDPHIWLGLNNARTLAEHMVSQLSYSRQKLEQFEQSLDKLVVQATPDNSKQAKLWVYHDAYAYLERDLNVRHSMVLKENHNAQIGLKHWQEIRRALAKVKNAQDICLLSLPGFENTSEAGKLMRESEKLMVKNQLTLLALDPLDHAKHFQDYLTFRTAIQQKVSACLFGH